MSLTGLLQRLGATLEEAEVPFMVTGSLASTLYGKPRSTVDVDIVVVLNGASLARLLAALPRDVAWIVALQGEALDRAYIMRWAKELGVVELWEAVSELA